MNKRCNKSHISQEITDKTITKPEEKKRDLETLPQQETRDEPLRLFKRRERSINQVIGKHIYSY